MTGVQSQNIKQKALTADENPKKVLGLTVRVFFSDQEV